MWLRNVPVTKNPGQHTQKENVLESDRHRFELQLLCLIAV